MTTLDGCFNTAKKAMTGLDGCFNTAKKAMTGLDWCFSTSGLSAEWYMMACTIGILQSGEHVSHL